MTLKVFFFNIYRLLNRFCRRFTLRYLRDFGFGRRLETFEMEIQSQIAQYIDLVKNGPKYEHEMVCHFKLLVHNLDT